MVALAESSLLGSIVSRNIYHAEMTVAPCPTYSVHPIPFSFPFHSPLIRSAFLAFPPTPPMNGLRGAVGDELGWRIRSLESGLVWVSEDCCAEFAWYDGRAWCIDLPGGASRFPTSQRYGDVWKDWSLKHGFFYL